MKTRLNLFAFRANIHSQYFLLCCLTLCLMSCQDNDNKNVASSDSTTETSTQITNNTATETAENQDEFIVGDYDVFDKPYATENSQQVVVYEFFGYACPHCYSFQPYMQKWLQNKPDYVKLVRIPLNFQPSWEVLQQAYLTAQSMGIVEQSHQKLFDAIHQQHKRFNSIEEIAQWYADELGVNKEEFISTAQSFILDSKITQANNLGYKMQVTSTPTVIINGKYRASKNIQDRDKIMQVLDFLVKKEAKAMGLTP